MPAFPTTEAIVRKVESTNTDFFVHVTVHRNKFLFNKTNRRTNFPKFILSWNSTCFGQFLCPSSGVFHCTFGTGICHAGLMTVFKQNHPGPAWKLSLSGDHCDCSPRVLKKLATPLHAAEVMTHVLVNDVLEKRKSVVKLCLRAVCMSCKSFMLHFCQLTSVTSECYCLLQSAIRDKVNKIQGK